MPNEEVKHRPGDVAFVSKERLVEMGGSQNVATDRNLDRILSRIYDATNMAASAVELSKGNADRVLGMFDGPEPGDTSAENATSTIEMIDQALDVLMSNLTLANVHASRFNQL